MSGTLVADFGYAGMYFHMPSGLSLTLYRAYNPDLGRWLSRDSLKEQAGLNLYSYVANDPINAIDPNGQLLIGAIIGLISGITSGIAGAAIAGGNHELGAAITGAIVGGLIGVVVGGLDPTEGVATEALLQAGAIGALASFSGSIAGQLISNPSEIPDPTEVATETAAGALGGYTGQYGYGIADAAGASELISEGIGAAYDTLASLLGSFVEKYNKKYNKPPCNQSK